MNYVIMVLYILFSALGVVCFKIGSMSEFAVGVTNTHFSIKISWVSLLGLAFYVVSFLLYMGLIAKNDLSYLIPVITGAVYILILCSSVIILKETVGATHIVGSILILAGVVLMNLKTK